MSHALPGETLCAMPALGSLLRYLKSLLTTKCAKYAKVLLMISSKRRMVLLDSPSSLSQANLSVRPRGVNRLRRRDTLPQGFGDRKVFGGRDLDVAAVS